LKTSRMVGAVLLCVVVARHVRQDEIEQVTQVAVSADARHLTTRRQEGDGFTPGQKWAHSRMGHGGRPSQSAVDSVLEQLERDRNHGMPPPVRKEKKSMWSKVFGSGDKKSKKPKMWEVERDMTEMQMEADILEQRFRHMQAEQERMGRANNVRQANADYFAKVRADPPEVINRRLGPRVRLAGLTSQPELNGELGDLVSDLLEGDKIDVQLKIRGGAAKGKNYDTIRVKKAKLQAPEEALGGTLMENGSYDLSTQVVTGHACRVEGTSQDALNGQAGRIQGLMPAEAGKERRFKVLLDDGQIKSIKAGNLVLTRN